MEDALTHIVDRFAKELGEWLDSPSPSMGKIEALRSQIESMKGTLGSDALKAMKKALGEAEAGLKTQRQKAAGEAIAERCRGLGIRLEAGTPMKRKPRKKAPGAQGSKASGA